MNNHAASNDTHRAGYAHAGQLLAALVAATILIVGQQRQLRQGVKLLGNFRDHFEQLFSPEYCVLSALIVLFLLASQNFWRIFAPVAHAQMTHK